MRALVTVDGGQQYLITKTHVTVLDELGKETKQQCTLAIAPVLKPGMPLTYGCEKGEVTTLGKIVGVIWRGN